MPEEPVHSILKVLSYFDIFNYPLSKDEIYSFMDQQMHPDEVAAWLQQMTDNKQIFRLGNFYSLQNDVALRERRIAGNHTARGLLLKAHKIGSFLYQFPYVRGIGISGSLSKNYADATSDIDFFIITSANRLWIARTYMHLFKKLTYLTGHQHWYCMNYYVDEEALSIEERNIFTATELMTLVPVCGNGTIEKFFGSNEWAAVYFPNHIIPRQVRQVRGHSWIKKAAEWLLNNRFGNILDDYLMKVTTRRWLRKEQQHRLNMHGDRMGICGSKHIAKPNPAFLQKKILDRYRQKINEVVPMAFSSWL